MTSKLVDITAHDGPNYKPLVYFESWRVAILNDDPEVFRKEKTTCLERHNETDEVFVLLEGECTLYLADGEKDALGPIEAVPMELKKIYNVKKGAWHNLISKPGMSLLIVENADTGSANTDYSSVTTDQLP